MAGFNNSLQLHQTIGQVQTLAMTPQLQQAIRLLQLSTIELQQEIRQQVDLNPLLEIQETELSNREESLETLIEKENSDNSSDFDIFNNDASINSNFADDNDSFHRIDESGQINSNESYELKQNNEDKLIKESLDSSKSLADSTNTYDDYDKYTAGPKASKGIAVESDDVFEGETTETLKDHLFTQLDLSPVSGLDKQIATMIIDAIDDSGYLTEPLEEILDYFKKENEDVEMEDIVAVLKLVQHYDPLGVASRNVQECLLIQLNNLPDTTEYKDIAIDVVENNIALLSNRDYRGLCQKYSIKENILKVVIDLITSLNPRPGNFMPSKKSEFIIPDVEVIKNDDGSYDVVLNSKSLPTVRINKTYQKLALQAKTKADRDFFKSHEQDANWFLKSIETRNETLLKVSKCIVEHQKDFMDQGPSAMHPMILKDVAEVIEMNESTVSRITTQKFMHTPRGTFELKYFFSSSVSTDEGDNASSTAIKEFIKELISKENPRKPLSDNAISEALKEKGMVVARRTVAKYREAIGIASSSQRKQLV